MSTYESLSCEPMDELEEGEDTSESKKHKVVRTLKKLLFSRDFVKALVLGQCLSLLLCGTGVFSELLQREGVNIPTAQSFMMYCILCLVFTTQLAYRQGEGNLFTVLKSNRGWKYFIIGLIDVEANFLVVKAYSYTSITSVQVLDCFSIATVVVLSRFLLRTKYGWVHYLGVCTSIAGLGGLIAADVVTGKNDDSLGSNVALGDALVVIGAMLYGISNVAQEFVVKTFNKSEFLGMIGLFSTLVSGIQVIVLERDDVAKVDFTSYKVFLPWLGFVGFLFLIYTCMAHAIQQTSATVCNISILSADFYSLLFGIFLFGYLFHFLYVISFVLVLVGVAIYSFRPIDPPMTPINGETGLLR